MIHCQALQWGPPRLPLTPPLNLDIGAGSLTAVVGANGCGKSSLLKVIAGLQKPLAGRVRVELRAREIGYLVQQQAIDRQFPIGLGELVGAGLWNSRLEQAARREKLRQALADWQLDGLEQRPLAALSGGQLQRALLARLSLLDSPLLLLDEPDACLDEAGQELLWRRIDAWHREGRTLLLVCHDLASVRERVPDCLRVAADGCRRGRSHALIASRNLARVA
ncbi:ATP-binding cassette domain-containing protein [Pseudomonas citronellolis]|uniref:ATP-binding cassette domain-containing protein n=1 Tax=Pseudomonas citronellolis TaxID=53408 RepID=UPI0023E43609|nr:ATP-binding cassette domain-containing protein [Pseudomonas citronellolis]MDF3933077.1 ATP-binding cassette domain-containing protein [Pseudomonas citronellolis]